MSSAGLRSDCQSVSIRAPEAPASEGRWQHREEVFERVKEVHQQLGVEENQITEEASFRRIWMPTRSISWS